MFGNLTFALIRIPIEQGLIFGIVALGVYITYKVLDFPDLSVDGTFPLGAAVTAALICKGVNPWLALLISLIAGMLAGSVTGILHVKFGITNLLSGILVMTGLYSINMRITGQKAVMTLIGQKTIFPSNASNTTVLILLIVFAVVFKLLLDIYLKTKSGMLLRAVGDNAQVVTSLAKHSGLVKILGLALGNGLAAVGGSILCQQTQTYDITNGTGTIVVGLAAVIIGISIFKKLSFMAATTMVLLGAILYKICIQIALMLPGFKPSDMKLLMVALFTIVLIINNQLLKRGNGHVRNKTPKKSI